MQQVQRLAGLLLAVSLALAACSGPGPATVATSPAGDGPAIHVLAVESFLADIAQQVAGTRLTVGTLMPLGADPHGYEPAPGDIATVAKSDVLIVNGAGAESFLDELLQNAGGERLVIEASAALVSRSASAEEEEEGLAEADEPRDHVHDHEQDPHFWLDPINVIKYVENIRDGLSKADPAGATTYANNAASYIGQLKALDVWIAEQVREVPQASRKLVTNHESFGYFADRYGFRIVGVIVPSTSSTASPSAQQLARLVDRVRQSGVRAVFLETGSNAKLAEQLAQEVGIQIVTELYSHSITDAAGPAPTYLEMMRYNTRAIVEALRRK